MRTSLTAAGVVASLLLLPATASAQDAASVLQQGVGGAAQPAGGVGGMRVGEGLFLRAGIAAEAGYDTNVFYNDQTRTESAVLNVTPSLELTNANRDNSRPPFYFSLGLTLAYREYLTEDSAVKAQRAFNPTVGGTLAYAGGTMSASIADQFTRIEEAPYQAGAEPIIRDNNLATLQLGVAPGGGRIQTIARYVNTLDLFENDSLLYANRMGHDLSLDGSWKWLPKTALFLQVGVGYIHYLEGTTAEAQGKRNSIPYRAIGGLRGLVTPKLITTLSVGYGDAVYDDDIVNPTGMSNLAVGVGLTYTPIVFTSLGLSYAHEFRDSPIVGNYYDLDTVSARIAQQLGDFVLTGFSRWEYRRYKGFQGPISQASAVSRSDHIFQTGVQLDYFIQRWFYAGVGYAHLINRSSVSGATAAAEVAGLDFTKHLILARLGIKY
jgi:hypothetical protein